MTTKLETRRDAEMASGSKKDQGSKADIPIRLVDPQTGIPLSITSEPPPDRPKQK